MPETPPIEGQWDTERERLTSELQRLEEALSMAQEATGDGEEGSLVARLREAKKKRVRIEEEFERSSDRWRDERRRLNAEVDRLDRALQKAQAEARRTRSSEEAADLKLQSELNEAIRSREQLEAALETERRQRETDRESLREKIASLESNLVDAIERANNSARGDEARAAALKIEVDGERASIEADVRRRFEASLEEAQKAVRELEQEKGRLHLEIHRLQSAGGRPVVSPRAPVPEKAPAPASRFSFKDKLRARLGAGAEPGQPADPEALARRIDELEAELQTRTSLSREAASRAARAEARLAKTEGQEHGRDAWERERAELEARARTLEEQLRESKGEWDGRRRGLEETVAGLESRLSAANSDAGEGRAREESARLAASLAGAETRLREDAAAWDQERERMRARIGELEAAAARLGELETQASGSVQSLADLEAKFGRASAEWNEERESLTVQCRQLEGSLREAEVGSASGAETIRELEARLEAAEGSVRALQEQTESGSGLWSQEREELLGKIEGLERSLEEANLSHADVSHQYQQLLADFEETRQAGNALREQMDAGAREWSTEQAALREQILDLQERLNKARYADASGDSAKGLLSEIEASERKFETASAEWSSDRKKLESGILELERLLEESRAATERERLQMEADLEAAASRLATTEESLTARIFELEAALADLKTEAPAQKKVLEDSLAEAEQARDALEQELRTKAGEWEAERSRLNETIDELTGEVKQLLKSLSEDRPRTTDTGESAAGRGIASFGRVLSSLGVTGDADGGKSVAELEARRQALETRLQQSEKSRDALAARLQAATEEWDIERLKLAEQWSEVNRAVEEGASNNDQAAFAAQHAELQAKLRGAEDRYTSLEEASLAAARSWDEQRAQLEQEIGQWEQQVVAEAERVAEETRKALAEEYEKQLRELRSQKEYLESQLRSSGGASGSVGADPEVVAREMSRVDAEIAEINHLIEDPNVALSNVMRKNAERSELRAYRRGLSYLAEQAVREETGNRES